MWTYIPEVHSEGTQISHHAWGQKYITSDPVISFSQYTSSFRPAVFFTTQSSDQLFSSVKLLFTDHDVVFQFFLFVGHGIKFIVQSLKFVNNLNRNREKKQNEKNQAFLTAYCKKPHNNCKYCQFRTSNNLNKYANSPHKCTKRMIIRSIRNAWHKVTSTLRDITSSINQRTLGRGFVWHGQY